MKFLPREDNYILLSRCPLKYRGGHTKREESADDLSEKSVAAERNKSFLAFEKSRTTIPAHMRTLKNIRNYENPILLLPFR